jgi:1-acyl-sn-glycerol-3-phosphate acyltransferase
MITVARSLAFNVVMVLASLVLCLYGQVLRVWRPAGLIAVGRLWARICLAALRVCCGIRVEVEGAGFMPGGGAALIAAQHQSAFDTMVWLKLLPLPAYVLKRELLRLPLMGSLLEPSGFVAVDREAGAAALRKMIADCRAAAAAGRQIVIFPEGTRVAPGERGVLHPGVVALARALDLPIIPVATNSGLFWGRKAFRKRAGRLRIKVFAPLPPGGSREAVLGRLRWCYYEAGVDKSVEGAGGGI